MTFLARPISFKPPRLKGLSPRLTASHYENNYGAAVRRLNAIRGELSTLDPATAPGFRLNGLKREELIATNSMLLHEVYFESLGEGGGGNPSGELADAITRDFGSLDKWRAEFVAMGKALGGGSGWVLLTRSPRDGTLSNVWCLDHTHSLAGGTPVLALDMFEHSYHIDFGANPGGYVDAFMANIAWERVAARFAGKTFEPKPHTVTTTAARAMLEANPDLIVIDARLALDATTVPVRLRGARRAPPEEGRRGGGSAAQGRQGAGLLGLGLLDRWRLLRQIPRPRRVDAVAVAGGIGAWRADGMPTEPHSEGEAK